MDYRADEMTHDDIWDDSVLIESWNQALDEYKKYHSIHAHGGRIEDLSEAIQTRQIAKPETSESGTPIAGGRRQGESSTQQGDETVAEAGSTDAGEDGAAATVNGGSADSGHGRVSQSVAPPPQALLGSIRDEGMKRLLMSWYYAGYYTGLYEGQQKQERQHHQPE
ncbi:hypothetical protein NKR23_g7555 [Pleurostoma richardsiae]|uniref:Survival Motor Neuron Gemin2-binding domain-containing protein n=1 Tax=Pleurostoma richardsiae TaxID=41990 RepID=A0AA38RMR1_9PEZI|nr:hypothetical protein NKR23_g7555 [Pleurostoma richardsiae]